MVSVVTWNHCVTLPRKSDKTPKDINKPNTTKNVALKVPST